MHVTEVVGVADEVLYGDEVFSQLVSWSSEPMDHAPLTKGQEPDVSRVGEVKLRLDKHKAY